MKNSKLLSILLSVLTALLVVSASIAVPLLCRSFYYAHITPLGLEDTGLTVAEIQTAFNEVMDYCLGLRPDFSAGGLWWSESGLSHFADVRVLFRLNLWVLGLSLAALMLVFFWCCKAKMRPHCFLGHGPGFWAAVGLSVTFLMVSGLAALDFDRAFVLFHALFFPGKDNWIFNWQEDPVILLLPQEFFRNCAILILILLLAWCSVLIAADLWAVARRKKQARIRKMIAVCGGDCANCSGCSPQEK